jgi:hypothetical protein
LDVDYFVCNSEHAFKKLNKLAINSFKLELELCHYESFCAKRDVYANRIYVKQEHTFFHIKKAFCFWEKRGDRLAVGRAFCARIAYKKIIQSSNQPTF